MRRTQGTETSKYLQEKKIIMIPSVAASERGPAQTIYFSEYMGLWGPDMGLLRDSRTAWKGRPETVIARYTKF